MPEANANEPNTTPSPTPQTPTSDQTPAQTSTEQKPNDGNTTLLTTTEPEPAPAPAGAPDAYTDFKLPDGYTLDKATLEAASPIFKELGLNQDQAQKLVDLYVKQNQTSTDGLYNEMRKIRSDWSTESKAWLANNGGERQVKGEIGKYLGAVFANADGTPNTADLAKFNTAMDMTGAGDNPMFIRALTFAAKAYNESHPVQGSGPSQFGQKPGAGDRPSLAQAMFPGGPRSGGPFHPNSGTSPQGG